ncbi:NACHT, LRR and PYD domains-containing protein 1 homolog isoform X2 [Coregonus clupeaformis]|uniref:NACHT, LRR and PYD domains-containing protein 1 homolog isoform X2 n=1 Tax=Coregonus clupeaformis TaxID=59861 RepID=UPI001E1C5972|nr:NACHT, LRR and PYD domains-containing protein 1 homolog isoform X2 [Coregonus clupeaformis]
MEDSGQQGATLPDTEGECTALTQRSELRGVREKLQSELRGRCASLCGGTPSGQEVRSHCLTHAYVELLITEDNVQWHDDRHAAVRPVRPPSDMPTANEEVAIKLDDIFKPPLSPDRPQVKTVLTKGPAGSGKTASVQKFILNWAEDRANQDVDFMFVFPFSELNWLIDRRFSLSGLISHFHSSMTSVSETPSLDLSRSKMVFILDGLDQFNFHVDFNSLSVESDINKEMPLPVLLANLMWCQLLLPSAYVWVITRPAAASFIPIDFLPQQRCLTEIWGFDDPQKREFFRKRFGDQSLVHKAIALVMKAIALESSRNLCVLCQTPLCCEMLAAILENTEEGERVEIDTLTQLYTHFLLVQIGLKNDLNGEHSESIREVVRKLGKLAFLQLERGNIIFSESDVKEHGIDISKSSTFHRLCSPLIAGCEMYLEEMYRFTYTGIQDYLAALQVFLTYTNKRRNLLLHRTTLFGRLKGTFRRATLLDLHRCSVDRVLRNTHGTYDLFLCFLLGLSTTPNQTLLDLACLGKSLKVTGSEGITEITAEYIKQAIKAEPYPQTTLALFRGLRELGDASLGSEVRCYLASESRWGFLLEPDQCWELADMLWAGGELEREVFREMERLSWTRRMSMWGFWRMQTVLGDRHWQVY